MGREERLKALYAEASKLEDEWLALRAKRSAVAADIAEIENQINAERAAEADGEPQSIG